MNIARIPLDQAKLEQVITVCQLHLVYSDVLSAFEVETLWTINERALDLDLSATVTQEEWNVILGAHDALVKASRQSKAVQA